MSEIEYVWQCLQVASVISLIMSFFVREDFILLVRKEARYLLLPRNDDSRGHVTYFPGIVNNLVAVVARWKRYLVSRDNGWKLMTTGGTIKP